MIEVNENLLLLTTVLTAFAALSQIAVSLFVILWARNSSKEMMTLVREAYGSLRKVEGLTASKREQIAKQYDRIIDNLTSRLPITIASHASHTIFEAERRILTRLAELEPNLKNDEKSKEKMEDLIRTMENLEETIVALTAESVRKVLVETRADILTDQEISLAA